MGDRKKLTVLSRDGKELMLDIGLSPITMQKKLCILATFNFPHQRLQVEEALRTSEERLRLAKQAANLGIYDCDCRHKIIYWDEKMRELWGSSVETVTYEEFTATIHPEDRAVRQAAFNSATDASSHGGFNAEYRIINPINGIESWIASTERVYFENGCAHRLVGVVRDVTEQKNLQKRLQAQRDETENIFKQQVAARTASAIAHELNQPLTVYCASNNISAIIYE
jgi:two-component system, LuxR family, sensor kinase FixL